MPRVASPPLSKGGARRVAWHGDRAMLAGRFFPVDCPIESVACNVVARKFGSQVWEAVRTSSPAPPCPPLLRGGDARERFCCSSSRLLTHAPLPHAGRIR